MDIDMEMGDAAHVEAINLDDPTLAAIVPNKVHIRGLDSLATAEIRAYVSDHYGPVARVEWIDDTSANLLFSSDDSARDALVALAAVPIGDASHLAPGEMVPAKPFAAKPESSLEVRMAMESDRKERGAAARSRFYLLHPEHDPEERRRRNYEQRERRKGGDRGRQRRDDDDEVERFPESFYDEPSEPGGRYRDTSRGGSYRDRSYSRERSRGHQHQTKELFPEKDLFDDPPPRSLRDRVGRRRSASPRSRSPDSRDSRRNKMLGRTIRDHITDKSRSRPRELFPSRTLAGFDSKNRLDQLESAYGSARLATDDADLSGMHPDDVLPSTMNRRQRGINIHGAASSGEVAVQSEFNIKGAASQAPRGKELFPDQYSERGDRLGRRQGGDLFD